MPDIAIEPLRAFLADYEFGALRREGALALLPLLRKTPKPFKPYRLLSEAVASGRIAVEESHIVSEAIVRNGEDRPVLLIDGEMIVGARQNRTVRESAIVEPGEVTRISVNCIEAGRWHGVAPFRDRRAVLPPEVRAAKLKEMIFSRSPKARPAPTGETVAPSEGGDAQPSFPGEPGPDRTDDAKHSVQSVVWSAIADKLGRLKIHSRSSDLAAAFDQLRPEECFAALDRPDPREAGAILFIGDGLKGLELFDHPEGWSAFLRKLVAGYGLDALEYERAGGLARQLTEERLREEGARLLQRLMACKVPAGDSAIGGKGVWHLKDGDLLISAIGKDGEIWHLAVHRDEEGTVETRP
jgi:hypothetical protein